MDLFLLLALVFGLGSVLGMFAYKLKLPAILGYLIAGAILSFDVFNLFHGEAKILLDEMGKIGVTFLLFLVGLELPISELKKMGKVATATGIGQIVFTSIIGFFICLLLGFSSSTALFLSIALAFSSTIVIIKLLTEKRDIGSLYGKISIGFLLVQDFVAVGLFVVLSGLAGSGFSVSDVLLVLLKAVLLVVVTLFLSSKIIPPVLDRLSRSGELLFVASVAWCLGVAALISSPIFGFNVEIGGFLAGLAFSNAIENLQLVSRFRSLRDFFLTIFFVSLGSGLVVSNFVEVLVPALILSVFVLIGNPLIVMAILGFMGYTKRTSFLSGLTVAQISEFSLILMAIAYRSGYASEDAVVVITIVGAITMACSSYMILNGELIYRKFSRYLGIFQRKKAEDVQISSANEIRDHLVLFGHNRTGSFLLPVLEKIGDKVLVVDFNPYEIEDLKSKGKLAIYGDIGDIELYEKLNLDDSKLIVSTVPDMEDALMLLKHLKTLQQNRPKFITTASDKYDAEILYKNGADYVYVPQTAGAVFLAEMFRKHGTDLGSWRQI